MAKLKELKKAAEEMAEVMTLKPDADDPESKFEFADMEQEEVEEWIKEAVTKIEKGDEFSEETTEVIDEFKPKKGAKPTRKADPEPEPEPKVDPDDVDLLQEIEDCDKRTELVTITKEYDEFKSLRGNIASYKTLEQLRSVMVAKLSTKKAVPAATAKPIKAAKKEVEDDDDTPEEKPAKKAAPAEKKVKRDGYAAARIKTFAGLMKRAAKKPISEEEMVNEMAESCPGSASVSKFYVTTLIKYLTGLELLEENKGKYTYKG
jgi:hypothetical protein